MQTDAIVLLYRGSAPVGGDRKRRHGHLPGDPRKATPRRLTALCLAEESLDRLLFVPTGLVYRVREHCGLPLFVSSAGHERHERDNRQNQEEGTVKQRANASLRKNTEGRT